MMKAGWPVCSAGVWGDRYAEVRPPSHLFLDTSTPSDLNYFTVLYLPVQDLGLFLKEEHERTCRATKGWIYIVCK